MGDLKKSDSPESKIDLSFFGHDFQRMELMDFGLGTWSRACQLGHNLIEGRTKELSVFGSRGHSDRLTCPRSQCLAFGPRGTPRSDSTGWRCRKTSALSASQCGASIGSTGTSANYDLSLLFSSDRSSRNDVVRPSVCPLQSALELTFEHTTAY